MRHFGRVFIFCVVLDKILIFEVWVRLPGECSARFLKESDFFEPENAFFFSPVQWCSSYDVIGAWSCICCCRRRKRARERPLGRPFACAVSESDSLVVHCESHAVGRKEPAPFASSGCGAAPTSEHRWDASSSQSLKQMMAAVVEGGAMAPLRKPSNRCGPVGKPIKPPPSQGW